LRLIDKLDPTASGRLTFIHEDGFQQSSRRSAPDRGEGERLAGCVTWICDPMHGNTFERLRYKTRPV